MLDMVAFDADDTLWENEVLYSQAKVRFAKLMDGYETPDATKHRLDELEIANISIYGYGIKSFALSMIESAIEISQEKIDGREMAAIISLVREMLTAPVELIDGVRETIAELYETFPLMLITKGDLVEQSRKVRLSGLEDYFHTIEIVAEKSRDVYLQILSRHDLDPRSFLMVGNSRKSDILPVLEIGGQAVYIPQENTWFHEESSDNPTGEENFYQLEEIRQLPGFLKQLMV